MWLIDQEVIINKVSCFVQAFLTCAIAFLCFLLAGIPILRICASRICASQGRGWFHGFEMRVAVVILSSAQSGREYLLGPWYEMW